jgi:Cu(I)/Ag(I) efflux system membrane fusion protein
MKRTTISRLAILVIAVAVAASAGYFAGKSEASAVKTNGSATSAADMPKEGSDRKVLYWHDPMVPGKRFDKPGKSPFMDMQLVPVYANEGGGEGGIKVSSTLQQNLGIRFATVRREDTKSSIDVVGTTQFDESTADVVQSRVTGYIDHLYARAPMQRIKRGDPIASLFVPEWIAPQEEYLALKRDGNSELAAASRQRMRAMSIPDGLVALADRTGHAQNHMTLTSPVTGVVSELPVRDGAMVSPGVTIAKIAGLNKVWLVAEVPEALATSARTGMSVEASTSSDPNRKYAGKVREILPGVNTSTRTVQARLKLDNKDGSLIPGLLMRVKLGGETATSRLMVPTEAVITTGKRSVVLVASQNNSMQPVVVTTGRDIGDSTEILTGLTEGQRVVASGQFLIDSEANLKSVLPKYGDEKPPADPKALVMPMPASTKPSAAASSGGPVYHGVGVVEKATPQALTFSHKPIPELQWGAMTMGFNKPRADAFKEISVGQQVEFSFKQDKDRYVLESVTPVTGAAK